VLFAFGFAVAVEYVFDLVAAGCLLGGVDDFDFDFDAVAASFSWAPLPLVFSAPSAVNHS
jgi:hypothetical protein